MSARARNAISHASISRVLPGLKGEYAIVSMPYWAWYWLDDLIKVYYPDGYDGLINETKMINQDIPLNSTLQDFALFHYDQCMIDRYHLANDNNRYIKSRKKVKNRIAGKNYPKELRFPLIFKLFGFMSCITGLEAVWERRNYPKKA